MATPPAVLCGMHGIPRSRHPLPLLASLLALSPLAGCSRSAGVPEALESVQQAQLEPGAGVGSLRLQQTTLGDALRQFGRGRASVVAGDEYGFELDFGAGAISLLFVASPECHRLMMRGYARDVADELQQQGELPEALSACAESRLASVAFAAPEDSATGFYQGRVAGSGGLGWPLEEMEVAHGPTWDIRGLWLAGSRADEPGELLAFGSGLALYAGPAPDGPNEGRQVVRKLAIFVPE